MTLKGKILISSCLVALILFVAVGSLTLYLYLHPSLLKTLVENALSRNTGASVTIKSLSYGFRPLNIHAEGILFRPDRDFDGYHIEIPALSGDMILEGPFTRRTLIIKSLKISGFSLLISKMAEIRNMRPERNPTSFTARVLRGAVSLFFFRDIRFQALEITGGEIRAQLNHLSLHMSDLSANLIVDQFIEISCRTKILWPSQEVSFHAPRLFARIDPAISLVEPQIRGTLRGENARFLSPEGEIKDIDWKAGIAYSLKQESLTINALELLLNHVDMKQIGTTGGAPSILLKAGGRIRFKEMELIVPHFSFTVNNIHHFQGKIRGDLASGMNFNLYDLNGRILPQKLLGLLPDKVRTRLTPFKLTGPIDLSGRITARKRPETWDVRGDLTGLLGQNPISFTAGPTHLNGKISGSIRADLAFPDINLSAGIKLEETALTAPGIHMAPLSASLSLSGQYPRFLIENLAAHIPRVKTNLGGNNIQIDSTLIEVRQGEWDMAKSSLVLPKMLVNSSLFKNLRISLGIRKNHLELALVGKGTGLIESARQIGIIPPGWEVKVFDDLRLKASLRNNKDGQFHAIWDLKKLSFQNPDGRLMGEDVVLNTETKGRFNLKKTYLTASGSLEAPGGETLFDRFYINLDRNPFLATYDGVYDVRKKSLRIAQLQVGLKNILKLFIQGESYIKGGKGRTHFMVNVPDTPLKPAFDHLLLEPFKREKPILTTFDAGGTISSKLEIKGIGPKMEVMGHFRWHEGELSSRNGDLFLGGINLNLPLWYRVEKREKPLTPIPGSLVIDSMRFPQFPAQSLKIPLEADPNGLSVTSPITMRIPGGNIRLGPITCRDLFGSEPSMDTSLTMDAADFASFFPQLPLGSKPVTIDGTLDRLHIEGNRLTTRGKLEVNVFGGLIELSDIGASDILSSTPLMSLNARLDDLDLESMTAGTAFGRIEGILRGTIRNLEIAAGQPQRFDLHLETVKRKGVRQRISLKAVDNISQIGGGGSPFMGFSGVITSFFKEFPYQKIGVRAVLENDVFKINGTIREGGHEYLVKRSGFSGVNVINQNPDNRIRFKDMIKRMKRITAGKKGPVIE